MANCNPTDTEEIWKTISDFPNYEISNLGRIRRVSPAMGARVGRILRPCLNKPGGYLHLAMRQDGKYFHRYIHRLVTESFHGPCPSDHECNHIDGVRTNNRADNLEWVTSARNKAHAITKGLMNNKGSNHGISKLIESQVVEIKRALTQGATLLSLAKRYGVCSQTISNIKHGKIWKHV